jgi:predicted ATPase
VEAAVEERVLEPQLPSAYRFAHDNIQESVIRLMPPEEFQALQAQIGFLLFRILSKNEAEDFLFVAVDLLNSSGHSSVSFAELNCRAARKAQHLSAFTSASKYIDHGIPVFLSPPIVRWEIDESLALELLSIGAEVELCLGNVEKAAYYSRYIIDREEIKPLDKVRAYRVHAKILYMGGNPNEALKVCLDILSQLGCIFPKGEAARQRQAHSMLESTKRMYFTKMDNLADRGFITDLKLLEIVSLLEQGASTALQAKDKAIYILQRCRCVQLILDHGLSNEAASCFASFANIMMHEKGDWTAGVKLANLALTIQEQLDSKYTETSTCFKTNHLVFGWALPLKSRLKTIVNGYKSGMISGNVEGGCWCLMLAIWCQFYDHTPLDCVSKDCQAYIANMENLRQINQANMTRWTWQLVLNFVGDPANPNTSVISGTAMAEEAASSMVSNFCMKTAKLFACAHFGHYATGAKIALEVGESHYEMLSGMAVWGFERFDRAICLYAYGRQTNRRKYIKAAKAVRSRLQEWVSKGAVNLKHLLVRTSKDFDPSTIQYDVFCSHSF